MPSWFGRSQDGPDSTLHIVVGLGNPGSRFERTRHNIGFDVTDALAGQHAIRLAKSRHRALTGRGVVAGVPVLLAKPQTFMNESGFAVAHLVHYYRVPLENILVVCDDIDLPFGTIRLRPDGSSGGQKGLESVIRELGSNQFPRLRVGVGRPQQDAIGHVLSRFQPVEEELIPRLTAVCCDAICVTLVEGIQAAMNQFNGKSISEEPVRPDD